MFALIILTLSTDLSHLHDWKHCAKCVLKNCPFHQRKMKGKRNVAAKSPKWRFPWWYTQILQAIWKEMWTYRWASIRERFLKETNKHNFKNYICKRFKWKLKKKIPSVFCLSNYYGIHQCFKRRQTSPFIYSWNWNFLVQSVTNSWPHPLKENQDLKC